MHIKISKDIPGFKKGETPTVEETATAKVIRNQNCDGSFFSYSITPLIKYGYAEEVDMLDQAFVESLRRAWNRGGVATITKKDIAWFSSFQIVKAVIEKLNDGWKPDWENMEDKFEVYLRGSQFLISNCFSLKSTIIPSLKSKENAEKVIELCRPELKILFNI